MATIALSAAGAALGGSIGGSVLGLSMATIGRAVGAAVGRRIDERIMGSGSEPIETGRVDRFRLTSAAEGADIRVLYGRLRVPGQVIWASQFSEVKKTSGGGKGAPPTPEVTTYSYTVNIAVALCEGEISRIGRIWADGEEISPVDLNLRVYTGTDDQQPDPKIAAVEGLENTPAYRGTAYVVLEGLPLGQFGNRIPQLTFEVMRPAPGHLADDLSSLVSGVALIPGTGEYGLATSQVFMSPSYGEQVAINTNSPSGQSDFLTSLDALEGELPGCQSVVLVVSWFGDDLRCESCEIRPKVEQNDTDAEKMPWQVSGLSRSAASQVPLLDGQPVYGGTPTDASVFEAIVAMRNRGMDPVFYPFILMEQLSGNTLPDPYTGQAGQAGQPTLPWRGRITSSLAPGVDGSPDGTASAEAEVAAFMGNAETGDFVVSGDRVTYNGDPDWGYRRFILHYAHLCAAAGGVGAFCIGSEMRGLTQIRGAGNSFPAVEALRVLATDVRAILGPNCKISYAADWTEYHGYQPAGTADKFFHLDALWADPNIDFIGVDNYMPLSDWREGEDHADADAKSIYNLDYLTANVAGGEGYDWYYSTPEARDSQRRSVITDGDDEPWVWRYKDFEGWWGNHHHNRVDGVRQATPTAWTPGAKPIWFTEFGCAAIDKGTNQPNKFLDPKSSESQLPYYSSGNRDDLIQVQYIRAVHAHFADRANNPISEVYGGSMIDVERMHVWAWDARPYPYFPGNRDFWSDGDNYARGHWLNGRATNRSLASVVAEICEQSGVTQYDVSELYGIVRGYAQDGGASGRAALQPLMLAYGFDAVERGGKLVFRNRSGRVDHLVDDDTIAIDPEADRALTLIRGSAIEVPSRVQASYLDADADYAAIASEAVYPASGRPVSSQSELPLALTRGEGQHTTNRWLYETRIARDSATFALPPSQNTVGAGDVIRVDTLDHDGLYRIDRADEAGMRMVEATRIDAEAYKPQVTIDDDTALAPFTAPVPVELLFLDLPLLTGDELPHAPHVAAAAAPWPGDVALYSAAQDSGYLLDELISEAATIGTLISPLASGPVGIWDRQAGVRVNLTTGTLSSAMASALLSGANTIAIGDGTPDQWEILQFQSAAVIANGKYEIRGLLRGQLGTHGLMPSVWPAGSIMVLLDGSQQQLNLASSARRSTRHFRYGPASKPITDASYRYASHAFAGNGLRPYPVVHLKGESGANGLDISWIRSSRIDGDLWSDQDIPLGEDSENYEIRIIQDGIDKRVVNVSTTFWTYDQADLASDVGSAPFRLEVAQLSARFGAGPAASLILQA
ncbi:glycoside hydrolase/phage tail family protein [Yoonia sp. BS5-3]|uniref:Glycoside hydrolase/phage tail family protein n=1 Tax=Yoonia phaeophyticola TaxID=3137369 RepID=A0ABZ2V165_9RHOB